MEVVPLLLEVVAHLEDILAPILRVANFRSNYLLTEYPEFHQINAIRCRMAMGFPKSGHNRNWAKIDTVMVLLKSIVKRLS
jgi:hypothetical protein